MSTSRRMTSRRMTSRRMTSREIFTEDCSEISTQGRLRDIHPGPAPRYPPSTGIGRIRWLSVPVGIFIFSVARRVFLVDFTGHSVRPKELFELFFPENSEDAAAAGRAAGRAAGCPVLPCPLLLVRGFF